MPTYPIEMAEKMLEQEKASLPSTRKPTKRRTPSRHTRWSLTNKKKRKIKKLAKELGFRKDIPSHKLSHMINHVETLRLFNKWELLNHRQKMLDDEFRKLNATNIMQLYRDMLEADSYQQVEESLESADADDIGHWQDRDTQNIADIEEAIKQIAQDENLLWNYAMMLHCDGVHGESLLAYISHMANS